MGILMGTFILAAIASLLIYFLHSNDGENSSIPYVTYKSYPIVGHLFPFLRDRTNFLMDCQQRYGQCFKIRLLNRRFTLVHSLPDWTAIIRSQSFHLPVTKHLIQLFDVSNNVLSMYQYLL